MDKQLAAGGRQFVKARFPIVVRNSPFRSDRALSFQALQGGIERAVIDQELIFRRVLNRPGDSLAVLPAEEQRAQYQQIYCALQQS
jgi:hypothetical protein